ncbi:MAG TPA: hypothetical protein VGP70_25360 [Actinomadura sp.]|nr:hypothetical protein [Actinomadura sp.]
MNWQAAGPGMGGGADDPFSNVEAQVRAMVASPWWRGAAPPQRAQAVTSQVISGAGEWWLYGAWGRWYRCGLDGHWHPCPPPADTASRHMVGSAPSMGGNPPVPSHLFPVGPDIAAGRIASTAFLGKPPGTEVVAQVQQALITALSVNPAQFVLRDPAYPPGTPSTVAAAWGALLWCAGAPVVLAEHPLVELFVPYLTAPGHALRWMTPPDLSQLTAYYTDRLRAGDGVGASHLVRVMHQVATGLHSDSRFRPGAGALAAITAATLPMVQHDMAAARYGPAAVTEQWRHRCPAEYATPMLRDGAPGEHLRLGLYDLTQIITALHRHPLSHGDARRASIALLAADLQGAPHTLPAVLPWLDPDSAHTLQVVLAQPGHPLRELWPRDGRLPEALRSDAAEDLEALLTTSYAVALAWCRLARIAPPAPGLAVPAAVAAELAMPGLRVPKSTGELTPWEIIEAARAHLAEGRTASREAAPRQAASPPGPPVTGPAVPPEQVPPAPPLQPPGPPGFGAMPPPFGAMPPEGELSYDSPPYGQEAPGDFSPRPPVPTPPAPPSQPDPALDGPSMDGGVPAPEIDVPIVEAYGTRFLSGPDDIGRLLTEVRRRAKWTKQLRGQEVSSASAPALLLLGPASCGQRRLTRMIARALAEVDVSSGEVHSMPAEDLRERGPEGVRAALGEHAGHTLLLERLDILVLDDTDGGAYAEALYRARAEGVSDTTLVATCTADRLALLSAASPELVTDFRAVRLPDLGDPALRSALLGLLAGEREVNLSAEARELARQDLARLPGRGRFTNARIVEVYLDRACANQLGRAGETLAIGTPGALALTPEDLRGIAHDLSA